VDVIDRDRKLQRTNVLHRDPGKTALCEMFRRLPVDARHARIVSAVVESEQPRLMAEVSPQYIESVTQDDEHLGALRELAARSLIVVPLLARGSTSALSGSFRRSPPVAMEKRISVWPWRSRGVPPSP